MNREQFTALVKSEQESLRRFLFALCIGNQDDADDIAQEALIKAYLARDKYCEREKFGAWLCRIAYHTFLDKLKTRHEYCDIDEAYTLQADTTADGRFEYQELYAALRTLPTKERTAILLYYLKGYTTPEIAAILECSEEAVRKQLSRGREQLKTKMQR